MKVKIFGKEFDAAYTISAQKEIAENLGGLDQIKDALTGDGYLYNLAMMASAILKGGERRERLRCKMYGEKYVGNGSLTKEELEEAAGSAEDVKALTQMVLQTMLHGEKVTVELAPQKKEEATR